MSIKQNLSNIYRRMAEFEEISTSSGKKCVRLLAVSKTKPVDMIFEAIQAGQKSFGENYVQEGVDKIHYFQSKGIELEWHFIGPLQSNKTRLVAENFDWCQTIERRKIAERLNDQRPLTKKPLNVLIQINISQEETKAGILPCEMLEMANCIQQLPNLVLRGLMAIPAPINNTHEQEKVFEQMYNLYVQLQKKYPEGKIDTLSMGMTDDMETAIKCGSTMVRIGSAIFGARK